jgi:hypothetical protein
VFHNVRTLDSVQAQASKTCAYPGHKDHKAPGNGTENGKVFGSFGPFRRSINGVFDTKTRDNGYVIITLRVVIITMTDKNSQNPELTDHK